MRYARSQRKKLSEVDNRLSELQMLRDELRTTLKDWDQRLARQGSGQRAGLLEALGRRPAGA